MGSPLAQRTRETFDAFGRICSGEPAPARAQRIGHGLSQAEAAMLARVGRRHMSRIEHGLWPSPATGIFGDDSRQVDEEWAREIPLLQITLNGDAGEVVVAVPPGQVAAVMEDLTSGRKGFAVIVDLENVVFVRRSRVAVVSEIVGSGICAANCDDDDGISHMATIRILAPREWSLGDPEDYPCPPGASRIIACNGDREVPFGSMLSEFAAGRGAISLYDLDSGHVSISADGIDVVMIRLDVVHPGFADDERGSVGIADLEVGRPRHSADVIVLRDARGLRLGSRPAPESRR